MDLSNAVKTIRIKPDASGFTVAAGAADVNSDIVDTAGYDGIRFIVGFGAIVSGAATSIRVQQDADSAGATMADLAGTSITVSDTNDNKMAISDIIRPQKRYLRVTTKRATQNSTVDFALAELYRARNMPVTQDATVISAEIALTPLEGTA